MPTVYVVITEEWYGGEHKIQVFDNAEAAEEYKAIIEEKYNLDVVIYRRELLKASAQ